MIDVVYVGSLIKDLGLEDESEQIEWREGINDVATLIDALCQDRGEDWTEVLGQHDLLVSVNKVMVKSGHPVADGDEVVIFPPMHGG